MTGVVAQGDGYRVSMTDGAWHANSGAQMAVDLAGHADVTWCTAQPPRFLPDDVDGRELFRVASRRVRGRAREWRGDIVVVPRTDGPVAVGHPRLGFVGYGDWCGLASATLIGVGQRAREAVHRALGSR